MVDNLMWRLTSQLEWQGLGIELTQAAKELLAVKGYDPLLGARPLRRAIQRLVEDPLSEMILFKQFHAGEIIVVDIEDDPDKPGKQRIGFQRRGLRAAGRRRAGQHGHGETHTLKPRPGEEPPAPSPRSARPPSKPTVPARPAVTVHPGGDGGPFRVRRGPSREPTDDVRYAPSTRRSESAPLRAIRSGPCASPCGPASPSPGPTSSPRRRHAEATGWDGVYVADHFMGDDGGRRRDPRRSRRPRRWPGWPPPPTGSGSARSCSASPTATRRCWPTGPRRSTTCRAGRLLLGLGAGWQINEHEQYGIELGRPASASTASRRRCQVLNGLLRSR